MAKSNRLNATDCMPRSTDWTTIGTRILQVATVASSIHLMERVNLATEEIANGGRNGQAKPAPSARKLSVAGFTTE